MFRSLENQYNCFVCRSFKCGCDADPLHLEAKQQSKQRVVSKGFAPKNLSFIAIVMRALNF